MLQNAVFPRRGVRLLALALLILLGVGSLWDYPLSCALYGRLGPLGPWMESFGFYPAALGVVLAGALLAAGRAPGRAGILHAALGAVLTLLGGWYACAYPLQYWQGGAWVPAAVGAACCAVTLVLGWRLGRRADPAECRRAALVLVLVIAGELLLVNGVVKLLWARPRFRLLLADPQAYFVPWWRPSYALRRLLLAAGAAPDDCKSFPSGHTANAAAAVLLVLLARLDRRLAGRAPLLLAAGALWGALVGLSRIVAGAHYLTDTVAGFSVTLLLALAVCRAAYPCAPAAQEPPQAPPEQKPYK
jgi:membrane-associated phospholipid phosphatase